MPRNVIIVNTIFDNKLQETVAQQQKAEEEAQARAQARAQAPSCDMSKARIQFKLPTGESVTQTFQATDTLGNLRVYVLQNVVLPFRHFSMSAFFPRRDFSTADDSKTLTELELVPSSVILILPMKSVREAFFFIAWKIYRVNLTSIDILE